MDVIEYIIDPHPKAEDDKILRDGIVNFNSQTIHEKATHVSIFARLNTQIIGGALIWAHSDALYIDVLWCADGYRNQGVGSKIITMIEGVAIDKQVPKLFVDTYTFQAQIFYQKHGFYHIGTIPAYLLGYDRIFMKRDLL